jgi:superfamily I DNA/RNA helicase
VGSASASGAQAWLRDPTEPGGEGRRRNVSRSGHARLAGASPRRRACDYLRVVALDSRRDRPDEDRSRLTLHAAKSLEPFCFVVGCQEGLVPHQRTIDPKTATSPSSASLRRHHARRPPATSRSPAANTFHGTEPRPSRFPRIPPQFRIDVDR